MATGNSVIVQLSNVTAPVNGSGSPSLVSFGGAQTLQGIINLYLEVVLEDPTNTGPAATFEIQVSGGIQSTNTVIGTITAPGLVTLSAPSPITYWRADLISLSGGTAPKISVLGVAGE